MSIIDWNKISDKQKQEISKLKPIFICGPRNLSKARIVQLIKQLGAKKSLIWGCLKDEYINGLEGSDQFRALKLEDLVRAVGSNSKVTILHYYQRDWKYILHELDFTAVILISGSWYRMLHLRPEFWEIVNKKTQYKLVSPFVDEKEAISYADKIKNEELRMKNYSKNKKYSNVEIMQIVAQVAKQSFATDFQTSCVLVKNGKILATTYNKIVPFETYAMHYGSVKEKNFSPPNDLNHYDTNHAEVELMIKCAEEKINMEGTSLYINLLPCPTCTRMFCSTKIKEFVYQHDHSDGYAYKLLTKAGKIVRRVI